MNEYLRILFAYWLLAQCVGCGPGPTISPMPDSQVEVTRRMDGEEFKLASDGNVYRMVDGGKRWSFHAVAYDPVAMANAFVVEGDEVIRVSPDSDKRYRVLRNFTETFEGLGEGVSGLRNLVEETRQRWGSFTLQSSATPTVEQYVELRQKIIAGESDFLDAVVAPTNEQAHSGESSLKCVADVKSGDMITTKSSLSSPLLYFKSGDDFWFEAYYFVQGALPMTLVDLECEFAEQHPGIRLCIFESGQLGVELKALDKPKYRQRAGSQVKFPTERWVRVKAHFGLSITDGVVEVWQEDAKIVNEKGTTLPFRSAIYSSLEVGISAHSFGDRPCTLYVDDVRVSDAPLPDGAPEESVEKN